MEDYRSLSHTKKWQCKYHIVFIPKYRKRQLYGVVRKHLGEVFHRLAKHKECWIEEGHVMPDHVHMLINVPPKLAVSSVVGYIFESFVSETDGCNEFKFYILECHVRR